MFKRFSLLILALVLVMVSVSAAPCDGNGAFYQELELETDTVMTATSTVDFTILVHVDPTNTDFWNNVVDGNDVWFASKAVDTVGFEYYYDGYDDTVEDFNAWVNITDTFDHTADLNIYMCYDSAAEPTHEDEPAAYPSNVSMALNLGEASGTVFDSTSNNNDSTSQTIHAYGVAGQIGTAAGWTDSTDGTGFAQFADSASLDLDATSSICFWRELNTAMTGHLNGSFPIAKKNDQSENQYLFYNDDGDWGVRLNGAAYNRSTTAQDAVDTWVHFCYTWDGAAEQGYINGSSVGAPSSANGESWASNGDDLYLGNSSNKNRGFDGSYDQVVFRTVSLTSSEAALLYNSENDSLINFGAQTAQAAAGGAPTVTVDISPNPGFIFPDDGDTGVVISLNSSNSPSTGATILDGNWLINGVFYSGDENTTLDVNSRWLDINVSRFARDQNGMTKQDTNLNVREAPFDLNTIWSPTIPGKNEDTDFNSTADSNGVITAFMLEVIGDANYNMSVGAVDGNLIHSFSTAGSKSLRLHVQNQDTNEQSALFTVAVAGTFRACIVDENYSFPIVTASVTANGVAQSIDVNGCFNLGLGSYSTTTNTLTTFIADANAAGPTQIYSPRTFQFDLNQTSDYDVNFLLVDENGNYIPFVFWNVGRTAVVANTFIQAFNPSIDQIAGRVRTTAAGEGTFYLNPNDPGYIFQVETATGAIWYYVTVVTAGVPISEADFSPVSPFDIAVGGLGYQDYNGLTAAQTFPILSNTVNYYTVTVDCSPGSSDYFTRQYAIRTQGGQPDANTYALQPYCVDSNVGVAATFNIRDKLRSTSLEDILVVLKKNIPGTGQVIVESTQSDVTGIAILAYILGDATGYTIEFYNSAGFLLQSNYLRPALSSYTVDILTERGAFDAPTFTNTIPRVVFSPVSGYIAFDTNAALTNGFDVNVSGDGNPAIRVTVSQGTTVLDTNMFNSYQNIRFDYNGTQINTDKFLRVDVMIQVGDNNYSDSKIFYVNTQGFNFINFTESLVTTTGELGPGAGIWILIIGVLAVLGGLGATLLGAIGVGVGIIVLAVAGLGVALGLIDIWVFVVVLLATFGGYLFTR